MGNRALIRMLPFVLFLLIAFAAHAQTSNQDDARNRPGDFVINRPAILYQKPSADALIVRQLHAHTIVRVVQVLDQWYKVESTKGHESGFIRRSYADPYGGGGGGAAQGRGFRVGTFRLTDPVVVREQPSTNSPKLATLRAGAEVRVVEKDPSGLWYKIESETGNRPPGWIPTQAAKRIEGR
jgi:Bacterial SH3 domain